MTSPRRAFVRAAWRRSRRVPPPFPPGNPIKAAAAGLLAGRNATTHWLAMDELARQGATPKQERYVFDGKYATSAGVSA
jgi:DJ-1/PfpI family